MIENLKPFYNRILQPFAALLGRLGVSPNALTIAGTLTYVAVGILIAKGHWKIAVAVGVAGACMDGLDGLVARASGRTTAFGAVLDSTCDRLTEILCIGGIAVYYILSGWIYPAAALLCIAALTGSLMVSYVKARAEGAGIECKKGLFQRPERLFFLGVFLVLGDWYMVWGLGILAICTWATVFQRLILVAQASRQKAP